MSNKLQIGDKTIFFEYDIEKTIKRGDILVVLLEPPNKKIYNENILGVDSSGRVIWQIEKKGHIYQNSPYVDLNEHTDGVWAGNWDGSSYRLDIKTGKVVEEKYTK